MELKVIAMSWMAWALLFGMTPTPSQAHIPPCAANQATYVVAYTATNVSTDAGIKLVANTRDYAREFSSRVDAEWELGRLRQTSGYSLGSTTVVYANIRLLVAYREGVTTSEFSPPKEINVDSLPDVPRTPEAFKKQKKEKK